MLRKFFAPRPEGKKGRPQDEFDQIIARIERFAPRRYRSDRDSFFYNYRMISTYRKPLAALLQTVAQKSRLHEDRLAFAVDLFLKLKCFYDPRDRLSRPAAVQDPGLRRKFREIFRFFYGEEGFPVEDVAAKIAED